MKPEQKSGRARTGDILGASGTWLVRCTREGCWAVEKVSLRQGEPAPPCRKCLNAAWLRFVHADIPKEEAPRPMEEKTIAPLAGPASIRTGEIVPTSGAWSIRCTRDACNHVEQKIQHKGAWADPCSLCHNPARLSFLHELGQAAPIAKWTAESPAPFGEVGGLEDLRRIARSRQSAVILPPAAPEDPAPDNPADKKAPAIAESKPTLFQKLSGGLKRRV